MLEFLKSNSEYKVNYVDECQMQFEGSRFFYDINWFKKVDNKSEILEATNIKKCLCEGNPIYTTEGLEIEVNKNILFLDYYNCRCGSFEKEFKINFCPICGKKLYRRKNNYENKKEK